MELNDKSEKCCVPNAFKWCFLTLYQSSTCEMGARKLWRNVDDGHYLRNSNYGYQPAVVYSISLCIQSVYAAISWQEKQSVPLQTGPGY